MVPTKGSHPSPSLISRRLHSTDRGLQSEKYRLGILSFNAPVSRCQGTLQHLPPSYLTGGTASHLSLHIERVCNLYRLGRLKNPVVLKSVSQGWEKAEAVIPSFCGFRCLERMQRLSEPKQDPAHTFLLMASGRGKFPKANQRPRKEMERKSHWRVRGEKEKRKKEGRKTNLTAISFSWFLFHLQEEPET